MKTELVTYYSLKPGDVIVVMFDQDISYDYLEEDYFLVLGRESMTFVGIRLGSNEIIEQIFALSASCEKVIE